MIRKTLRNKYLWGLLLLALPLSGWAWSECQKQRQISRGPWQAVINATGEGGCSLMEVDVAMGLRHEPPKRLVLRDSDPVTDIEFTDLDGNRVPELMLITRNVGSGSYGGVTLVIIDGQELKPLALPAVDQATNPGYRGHDRIYPRHDSLIREFPLYAEKDPNCCPTGGFEQLIYTFDGKGLTLK